MESDWGSLYHELVYFSLFFDILYGKLDGKTLEIHIHILPLHLDE